ncbi:hypothetical protein VTK73DRAFT_2944 [Phialemonium thermophilum]|uniref:Uncharacterized protein n=1 Tax=Phialemonium thermophilum TaxID=223376 RepID=A0ABR3VNK0_9PEZI
MSYVDSKSCAGTYLTAGPWFGSRARDGCHALQEAVVAGRSSLWCRSSSRFFCPGFATLAKRNGLSVHPLSSYIPSSDQAPRLGGEGTFAYLASGTLQAR